MALIQMLYDGTYSNVLARLLNLLQNSNRYESLDDNYMRKFFISITARSSSMRQSQRWHFILQQVPNDVLSGDVGGFGILAFVVLLKTPTYTCDGALWFVHC